MKITKEQIAQFWVGAIGALSALIILADIFEKGFIR